MSPTLVTREKPLRPVVFLGYKLEWSVPGQTHTSWCLLTLVGFFNLIFIFYWRNFPLSTWTTSTLCIPRLMDMFLLPSVGYGKYSWRAGLPACDFLILIFSGDKPSSGCDWLTGSTVFPFSKHLLCVFMSGSYHVPLRIEGTHFSTIASALIVCSIYANGPSGCCELIGFCNLGLHVFENS